jgi:hypothetical protein
MDDLSISISSSSHLRLILSSITDDNVMEKKQEIRKVFL